jgi:hypothetical protein
VRQKTNTKKQAGKRRDIAGNLTWSAGSEENSGQMWSLGVPSRSIISSSWFISDLPWNVINIAIILWRKEKRKEKGKAENEGAEDMEEKRIGKARGRWEA